jgi:hypothetical protein
LALDERFGGHECPASKRSTFSPTPSHRLPEVRSIESLLSFLPEAPARLVATVRVYRIDRILTFNGVDFK